jgi:DNA-binding transcriptional regulator LsrR (DeoR family)
MTDLEVFGWSTLSDEKVITVSWGSNVFNTADQSWLVHHL